MSHDELTARECATRIRDDFVAYNDAFRAITRQARVRFEQRDWDAGRADAVERIDLYDKCVNESARCIAQRLGDAAEDHAFWQQIKRELAPLVADYADVEFVKTYFSSVTRRVFKTVGVDPDIEFLGSEVVPLTKAGGPLVGRNYANNGSLREMFRTMLEDFAWSVPYEDIERCAESVGEQVGGYYRGHQDGDTVLCVDILEQVFYRDTRAYLVGKITGWTRVTPLIVAVRNGDDGICVDAVIQTDRGVSAIFGYARSYFHADFEAVSSALVFLKRIVPRKPVNELFTILGRAKQGKTERYRDFTRHLGYSNDRFIFAPGKRGLVMLVFTLPSYDIVFKVIRDRFGPPKKTTAQDVKERYDLVFKHDKVGRLVDTQEFRLLKLPQSRFSPDLLAEMLASTANTIRLEGDDVIIDHTYVERRLRPLDLYLREVGPEAATRATIDYGQALRDLACTNIFPGDLLLKNFGVSRHGRVIFYDYDELCLLTDCNFRDMPEPRTYEEEIAAEPWFYVGENDIFPEEFASFLGLRGELMGQFNEVHGELLTADYWRGIQDRIRAGEVLEVMPY